ncbi:MAG: type II secretion system F family protein [Rhodospirillales bacterium]|nr:type II secretion system F family protein [Rhodospirillales bacterium]
MLEYFDQNPVIALSIMAAVVFGFFAALLGFLLVRAHTKSRLGKRIAMAAGAAPGEDRSVDKKKAAQKRMLVQSKINEIEAAAKKKKVDRPGIKQRLETAGMQTSARSFHVTSAILAAVTFVSVYLADMGLMTALMAAVAFGLGGPRLYLSTRAKRRMKAFVDAFPDAVDVVVRGIQSGLPLGECMNIISTEAQPPVCDEFRDIMESMRLGLTLNEAMDRAVKRVVVPEFRFFGIVLSIQAETGGNLAETLGNLSDILRSRKKMKGKVLAMASEARTTAMVIGCLPFLMGLLLFVTSPDYITVLFTDALGQIMIGAGIVSMVIGTLVMSKMVNFKI